MKTVKDKYLVVGADFAGYPLKEAVVAHLKAKGWKITDLGVTAESDPDDTENMFHRVGLRVGSKISEGEFERALIFCGTGMGIHIAASKCPHVHAGGGRERSRGAARDHGQRSKRSRDGCVLCSAADGLRYCGRIPERGARQRLRMVA